MKKITPILFLMLCTIIVKAQDNGNKEPFLIKELSGENIKMVYARTPGGSIEIVGVNTGQAKLEIYVRANANNDISAAELKKHLEEDYELTIVTTNHQLNITALQKERKMDWKRQLNISFKITVPQNTATDLQTGGGSISLLNLKGNQKFNTAGGKLKLEKLDGEVIGKTAGGAINVKSSSGNISLSTSGGNIDLTELKGIIKVKTSGGNINGTDISGDLSAYTSGGMVKLNDITGSVDASTSGGKMDIAIKDPDKYVTLNNAGGTVNLTIPGNKGLDLKLKAPGVKVNGLKNFTGIKEHDEINGSVNGGGIPVNVHSSGGPIVLTLKEGL